MALDRFDSDLDDRQKEVKVPVADCILLKKLEKENLFSKGGK